MTASGSLNLSVLLAQMWGSPGRWACGSLRPSTIARPCSASASQVLQDHALEPVWDVIPHLILSLTELLRSSTTGKRGEAGRAGMLQAKGAAWGTVRAAAQPMFHSGR